MDLKRLYETQGHSIWLDYIRRDMIKSGEFKRAVEQDGLRGVTTNPSIFEKAIDGSDDYREALAELGAKPGATAATVYEQLAVEDIQAAADILRPLFDASQRGDGYISMEVSPTLAHDTQGTVAEALRLWERVQRPNLMIKVPATPEGLPAIRQLIGRGLNVNVTLLFSRRVCRQVADAYMDGLDAWLSTGGAPAQVASVASLFVSRMDVLVEPLLGKLIELAPPEKQAAIQALRGTVALANARLAYQDWKALHAGARWQDLQARGARPQRLLWASTSVKDPAFDALLYAEGLIGPQTVDTLPPETLKAFLQRGRAEARLEEDLDDAPMVMRALEMLGIPIETLCQSLLEQGLAGFSKSFDTLMAAIARQLPPAARAR